MIVADHSTRHCAGFGMAGCVMSQLTPQVCKPRMGHSLSIARFAIIEDDDIDEAIGRVSKTPWTVADGVVEVWALLQSQATSRTAFMSALPELIRDSGQMVGMALIYAS